MSLADFAEGLLDETRDEINRADSKASIILSGSGVAVAVLAGALLAGDITLAKVDPVVQKIAGLAAALLILGIGLLGAAVIPRMGRPIPGRARYFLDHAQYETLPELRKAVESEYGDRDARHLEQLLDLARLTRTKYRLTIAGELFTGAGGLAACGAAIAHLLLTG